MLKDNIYDLNLKYLQPTFSHDINSMEFDTPLNKAHVNVRKSEKLLKCGRFEEAIELQDRIVKLLKEALEDAKEKNIRDSLELQIEYHSQQKHIIAYKKTSWERLCQQLTDLQVKMSNESNSASGVGLQVLLFYILTQSYPKIHPILGFYFPGDDRNRIFVGTFKGWNRYRSANTWCQDA